MKNAKLKPKEVAVRCGVLLTAGLVFWLVAVSGPPSYDHLQRSCASAIQNDSRIGGVEAWLKENKIPYHLEKVPLVSDSHAPPPGDGFLYDCWREVGIPDSSIEHSTSYISFGAIPVRWGASALGYFLFSAAGTLVDYRLRRIGQPL